jgi:ribose 5-phosphate isomerase A
MDQNEMKKTAGLAAIKYIEEGSVIGVGTGSTVNFFIDALAKNKSLILGAVASSKISEQKLLAAGIPVLDLNSVNEISLYVDGADEINPYLQMIKGGGGALTREKIVAVNANKFICIADQTKKVDLLGKFPVAVEVIPMARSYVARQLVRLGGSPVYRENFITDNGNVILDVWNLKILEPKKLEETINNIVGVVCNGIFAARPANLLLLATEKGILEILPKEPN